MAKIKRTRNAKLDERLKNIKKLKGTLKVGILEGSKYPNGTPTSEIAQYLEYGTDRMPARPFMQTTIKKKSPSWGNLLKKLYRTEPNTTRVSGKFALKIQSDIVMTIRDGEFEPLHPYTVKIKGFDKTLIDTGHLMKSIDWEISNES